MVQNISEWIKTSFLKDVFVEPAECTNHQGTLNFVWKI